MKFPALRKISTPAQIYTAFNLAMDQITQALQQGLDFSENFRSVNSEFEIAKLTFKEIDISSLGSKPTEVTVVATNPTGNKGYKWAAAGGVETFIGATIEWYPVGSSRIAVRAFWPGDEDKIRLKIRIMGE